MIQCDCDRFEYLTGVATRAYMNDFFERTGKDEATGEVFYRCRLCGTPWKRLGQKEARGIKLIKLPKSAMV
jgi:hypothetical protein